MGVLNYFKRNKDLVLAGTVALSGLASVGFGLYHGRMAVVAETQIERENHKKKADAFTIAGACLFTGGNMFGFYRLVKTTNPDGICTPD